MKRKRGKTKGQRETQKRDANKRVKREHSS